MFAAISSAMARIKVNEKIIDNHEHIINKHNDAVMSLNEDIIQFKKKYDDFHYEMTAAINEINEKLGNDIKKKTDSNNKLLELLIEIKTKLEPFTENRIENYLCDHNKEIIDTIKPILKSIEDVIE